MRIRCSKCETGYDISADRIPAKGAKVKCANCGNVFIVRKKVAAAAQTPAEKPLVEEQSEVIEECVKGREAPEEGVAGGGDVVAEEAEAEADSPEGEGATGGGEFTGKLPEDEALVGADAENLEEASEEIAGERGEDYDLPVFEGTDEEFSFDDGDAGEGLAEYDDEDLVTEETAEEKNANDVALPPFEGEEAGPLDDEPFTVDFDFADFNIEDGEENAAPSGREQKPSEGVGDDFDPAVFDSEDVTPNEGEGVSAESPFADRSDDFDFSGFDEDEETLGVVEDEVEEKIKVDEGTEDIDFAELGLGTFSDTLRESGGEGDEEAGGDFLIDPIDAALDIAGASVDEESIAPPPPEEDEFMSIGELDLGTSEVGGEEDQPDDDPLKMPMEKVKEEDLLPPKGGAAGGAERRLPQPRPKRPAPKPRKRKSPLFAVVILVVLATACFLGYSAVYNPAAFTFLNPEKVKAIMESKKIKDLYPLSNVDGYYLERQGSDRMFVIKGVVTNRSDKAQSLMSIEGSLFSATGGEMASLVVFCGNNFTRHELEALPTATIDKRQQNRVGDALSNVDIAPGSGVTFMVVFTSPPDGVEKYSVTVLGPDSSGGD